MIERFGGNFDKTGTYGSLESTQRRNAHCGKMGLF
jgi:hypothetical protein